MSNLAWLPWEASRDNIPVEAEDERSKKRNMRWEQLGWLIGTKTSDTKYSKPGKNDTKAGKPKRKASSAP